MTAILSPATQSAVAAAAQAALDGLMQAGVNVEFSREGILLEVIRARLDGFQLRAIERTRLVEGVPDAWRGVAHDGTELMYGYVPSSLFPFGADPWLCFPITIRMS